MTQPGSDDLLAAILARLGEQRAGIADLERLVAAVPGLVRDSALGASGPPPSPAVELVREADDRRALWAALATREPVLAVLPGLRAAVEMGLVNDDVSGPSDRPPRVVVPAAELGEPSARARLGTLAARGMDVRTTDAPPALLVVVPGELAVLPLEPGGRASDPWVLVRDRPVVDVLQASFEDLWTHAAAPPSTRRERDEIMRLLAQGLSDGAIAGALDMSVRSVRRRIAEAAAEWGVSSRFALGAAWARGRR